MSEGRPKRKAAAKARETLAEKERRKEESASSSGDDESSGAKPKRPAGGKKKKAAAKAAPKKAAAAPKSARRFTTHNDGAVDTNGTSLQGEIDVDYDTLVHLFGEPRKSQDSKTQVEWSIRFKDGTVATIYDYKSGPRFGGFPAKHNFMWHVGGNSREALAKVEAALDGEDDD